MGIALILLAGAMAVFSLGFFGGAAWCAHFMRARIEDEVLRDALASLGSTSDKGCRQVPPS